MEESAERGQGKESRIGEMKVTDVMKNHMTIRDFLDMVDSFETRNDMEPDEKKIVEEVTKALNRLDIRTIREKTPQMVTGEK